MKEFDIYFHFLQQKIDAYSNTTRKGTRAQNIWLESPDLKI